MEFCECVTFFLIKDDKVLIEKRRDDKPLDPGLIAIPGGHVEKGETFEQALKREVLEELGLKVTSFNYVCSLFHYAKVKSSDLKIEEVQRIHYYLINEWEGEIQSLEAASLEWLPISEIDAIDVEADRVAMGELQRYLYFVQ